MVDFASVQIDLVVGSFGGVVHPKDVVEGVVGVNEVDFVLEEGDVKDDFVYFLDDLNHNDLARDLAELDVEVCGKSEVRTI